MKGFGHVVSGSIFHRTSCGFLPLLSPARLPQTPPPLPLPAPLTPVSRHITVTTLSSDECINNGTGGSVATGRLLKKGLFSPGDVSPTTRRRIVCIEKRQITTIIFIIIIIMARTRRPPTNTSTHLFQDTSTAERQHLILLPQ
ncbi:unnamed protein product [Boreogadus saida]